MHTEYLNYTEHSTNSSHQEKLYGYEVTFTLKKPVWILVEGLGLWIWHFAVVCKPDVRADSNYTDIK